MITTYILLKHIIKKTNTYIDYNDTSYPINKSRNPKGNTSLPAVDVPTLEDPNFPPSVSSVGATTRGPSVGSLVWTRAGQLRGLRWLLYGSFGILG